MTKYEGTIILKETGRENTVEEVQNLISAEIDSAGGKVGEVRRERARVHNFGVALVIVRPTE